MPPKKRSSTGANMYSNSGIASHQTPPSFVSMMNPSAVSFRPTSQFQSTSQFQPTSQFQSISQLQTTSQFQTAQPTSQFQSTSQFQPTPQFQSASSQQNSVQSTNYNYSAHSAGSIPLHGFSIKAIPSCDMFTSKWQCVPVPVGYMSLLLSEHRPGKSGTTQAEYSSAHNGSKNANQRAISPDNWLQETLEIFNQEVCPSNTDMDHLSQEQYASCPQVVRSESPPCIDPRQIFPQSSPEPVAEWVEPSEIYQSQEPCPETSSGSEPAEGEPEGQAKAATETSAQNQTEHLNLTPDQTLTPEEIWESNLYSLLRGELNSMDEVDPQLEEAPSSAAVQPSDSSYSVHGNDYVGKETEQKRFRGGRSQNNSHFKPGSSRKRRRLSSEDRDSDGGEVVDSTNRAPVSPVSLVNEEQCSPNEHVDGAPPTKVRRTSATTAGETGPARGRPPMDAPAKDSESKMAFLLQARKNGMSYAAIKEQGGFDDAVSTLRGKHRNLIKGKEERVRRPAWTNKDIELLKEAVSSITAAMEAYPTPKDGGRPAKRKKKNEPCWGDVAKYIVNNGGSYKFGHTTCRRKWQEICGQKN